jgi:hypothetical protein
MPKVKKVGDEGKVIVQDHKPYVPVEGITVEATALGYYGDVLRQPGNRFQVKNEKEIGSWMKIVDLNGG